MNEKKQSTDTRTEMNKTFELSDEDFKVAVLKLLQRVIINSLKQSKMLLN